MPLDNFSMDGEAIHLLYCHLLSCRYDDEGGNILEMLSRVDTTDIERAGGEQGSALPESYAAAMEAVNAKRGALLDDCVDEDEVLAKERLVDKVSFHPALFAWMLCDMAVDLTRGPQRGMVGMETERAEV